MDFEVLLPGFVSWYLPKQAKVPSVTNNIIIRVPVTLLGFTFIITLFPELKRSQSELEVVINSRKL